MAGLLDNLQSHHRTVVSALRGSYREDAADTLIAELEREGAALAAMLRDPAASEVTWVTLPEPMALEETSDALAALDARGDPGPPADREPRDARLRGCRGAKPRDEVDASGATRAGDSRRAR